MTLNYLNGSTGTAAIAVGDWFNNTPIAWNANGRINSGGYDNVNNNNPRLYYYDLTGLPTTSPLESISFQTTVGVGSNTHTAIMGISGNLVVAGITSTGAQQRLEPCRQRHQLEYSVAGLHRWLARDFQQLRR